MKVDLFDFDLPEKLIAVRPACPRHASRLLHVKPSAGVCSAGGKRGAIMSDHAFLDLPDLLSPGDCLVINDTKVIPARLRGLRGGAAVEVTLHRQLGPVHWKVFARPARKCRLGDQLVFGSVIARVVDIGERGEREILFDIPASEMIPALIKEGHIPLPPYIESKRKQDDQDRTDYQTVYAEKEGAVAAPTAGLHFTQEVFDKLEARSITFEKVTLHVGAGTFLPVTAEDTSDHKMHEEWGVISKEVADRINQVRARGGRIISVGTTSLRLLESAVDDTGSLLPFSGSTDIFITPGHDFKSVDALITNFHLPKSTLFMLVSAFSGPLVMRSAYDHAITKGYRFYSYGDSSLLEKADKAGVNAEMKEMIGHD